MFRAVGAFIVAITVTSTVYAQDSGASDSSSNGSEIVPLEREEPAPFAGMLFPSETAARWRLRIEGLSDRLRFDVERCEEIAGIRLEGLTRELNIERERAARDESRLRETLREVERQLNRERTVEWYESPVLWLSVGLVLGAAGVIAAVVAAGG